MSTPQRVICAYCDKPAVLRSGVTIYPHRPDLHGKRFWKCDPCNAWVGCHPNTTDPLGRLANANLRKAKQRAHAAFDPRWKDAPSAHRRDARSRAYAWLAAQLGITPDECHIGMFDERMCDRVVEVCRQQRRAA